ncbi:uncharacterized protein LOC112342014 isoform X2 [Selaginella moellendorffii]|uniref:uncharacterized protein LOC112342014 isoform X2 n=1 Tax=Selaginella moellendorffii TaxID=88036 RepID=UPI000D1CEC65|nr:uncharacterized protein LOC112342014 isoform X2 [Selaginella moellendorffii]|eukprot:XP_024518881.1 uncharacterized protein LOC112342014 isoform X2 [Selaginella moellendorffii]
MKQQSIDKWAASRAQCADSPLLEWRGDGAVPWIGGDRSILSYCMSSFSVSIWIALGLLPRFFQHHCSTGRRPLQLPRLHRPILASTLQSKHQRPGRNLGQLRSKPRAGDSHRDYRWVIPWGRWSATRPGRLNTIEKSEEVATLGPQSEELQSRNRLPICQKESRDQRWV